MVLPAGCALRVLRQLRERLLRASQIAGLQSGAKCLEILCQIARRA
jgi:hypothetical protein